MSLRTSQNHAQANMSKPETKTRDDKDKYHSSGSPAGKVVDRATGGPLQVSKRYWECSSSFIFLQLSPVTKWG